MSLYDFLYHLQRQSYQSRKRVLIGLVTISFLFLAAFWLFMFKNQVSQETNSAVSSDSAKFSGGDQKLLGPVAALVEGFRGLKNDIAQKIGKYKIRDDSGSEAGPRPFYELPLN